MKITVSVFHLAISNRALRHAVLHERHVAHHLLKMRYAPCNCCHVQLKPNLVIVTKNFAFTLMLCIHTYAVTLDGVEMCSQWSSLAIVIQVGLTDYLLGSDYNFNLWGGGGGVLKMSNWVPACMTMGPQ